MNNQYPHPYYALDAVIDNLVHELNEYKKTPYSKEYIIEKRQKLIDELCMIQHVVSPSVNYDLCCKINQIIEDTKKKDSNLSGLQFKIWFNHDTNNFSTYEFNSKINE